MDIYPLAMAIHQQIMRELQAKQSYREMIQTNHPARGRARIAGLLSILASVMRLGQAT